MGRLTIRVKYPIKSPNRLLKLFQKIIAEHKKLGANSPFNTLAWLDMDDFENKVNLAIEKREQAIKLKAESQGFMMDSKRIIGIAKGQQSTTVGTLMYYMSGMKHFLLDVHKNHEKKIQKYGFRVVIRKAKFPKKKDEPEKQKRKR